MGGKMRGNEIVFSEFDESSDVEADETVTEVAPDEADNQAPGAGRIVHYLTTTGVVRPAIVIGEHGENSVDLVVFNSGGAVAVNGVPQGDRPGTYAWPSY